MSIESFFFNTTFPKYNRFVTSFAFNMDFRTAYQDEDTQTAYGSNSFEAKWDHISGKLSAYNVCSYLNTLYKRAHYSSTMPIFYSSSLSAAGVSVLDVLSFNISHELTRLEVIKEESDPGFKKEYRYYFDSAIEELEKLKAAIEDYLTVEEDYIKEIEDFCDKLILKGFELLSKTYPEHGFYINDVK